MSSVVRLFFPMVASLSFSVELHPPMTAISVQWRTKGI
jgi:hypothetical protein